MPQTRIIVFATFFSLILLAAAPFAQAQYGPRGEPGEGAFRAAYAIVNGLDAHEKALEASKGLFFGNRIVPKEEHEESFNLTTANSSTNNSLACVCALAQLSADMKVKTQTKVIETFSDTETALDRCTEIQEGAVEIESQPGTTKTLTPLTCRVLAISEDVS